MSKIGDQVIKQMNKECNHGYPSEWCPNCKDKEMGEVEYNELEKKFNQFLKNWTGTNYPHLIDNDENAGEEFRQILRDMICCQRCGEFSLLNNKNAYYCENCGATYKLVDTLEVEE